MRTGGEVWTFVSSDEYKPYSALQGKYKTKLGSKQGDGTEAGFSLTLTKLTKYKVELGASVTFNFSYTRSGPDATEKVGSVYANHCYFVGIASGQVMKYVYKITDKYTGAFLRNETVYTVTNKKSTTYGILANYNASTDVAIIKSVSTDKTYTADEDTLISYWNSTNAYDYVDF